MQVCLKQIQVAVVYILQRSEGGGVSHSLVEIPCVRVHVLQVNCNPSTECSESTFIVWADS